MTESKMRTVFDANYIQRMVQATAYNKYRIEFLKKENYRAELLQFAESINIYTFDDKLLHIASVLDLQVQTVAGSSFQLFTLEYFDKNPDNYPKSYPVVNHLRSDALLQRGYLSTQLTWISLIPNAINGGTWINQYNYYSPFYVKTTSKRLNQSDNEVNGQLYNTRVTIKKTDEILLYLTESDLYNFEFHCSKCNGYNGKLRIKQPLITYMDSLEVPEVESEQVNGATDLYKVTVKITSLVTDNLTYAS